ncbi:protein FAM200C-like [Palaemon carinicauda]|uniref:protein FAM200C-like n=1 Tax=Palaemon carinicauda TaxID=392227 RepID=UPI0035B57F18
MKPHTTGEEIIGPACNIIVETMLGKGAQEQISKVPLSNNTISSRISEMSTDINEEVTTTTGEDIFASINSYLTQHGLSWNYCCGICTDGAPSMIGKYKGFITRALKENPSIIITHCFLHSEALVAKTCGEELTEVLNQAVKMGRLEGIVTSVNKMKGFQRKLKSWKSAIQKDDVSNFPFLQQPGYKGPGIVKYLILNHLEQTREAVDKYFLLLSTDKLDWIVSPFELADMAEELDFTAIERDKFLDMSADSTLQVKFEKSDVTLAAFWHGTLGEYPNLAKKAISLLLPFSTSYLCEQAFSAMATIKSKQINRLLSLEDDMRVALSTIRPDIKKTISHFNEVMNRRYEGNNLTDIPQADEDVDVPMKEFSSFEI